MGEKDYGLSLSLSLKCPEKNLADPKMNYPPPPLPFPLNFLKQSHFSNQNQRACSSANPLVFQSSSDTRSFVQRIDVNNLPLTAECEEELLVSSSNDSGLSRKRGERESLSGEEEDGGDATGRNKKLRLSRDQAAVLERMFKEHQTLNPKQKLDLANQLDLRPRQVEVWFQNRRARTKTKQTEVDCGFLKRCCEKLTEENKRLEKEVNELRMLKLSPQLYMNSSPPTTLTMCPQCERVAASSSSTSSTSVAMASLALPVANAKVHENGPIRPQPQRLIPIMPQVTGQRPTDCHPRWLAQSTKSLAGYN